MTAVRKLKRSTASRAHVTRAALDRFAPVMFGDVAFPDYVRIGDAYVEAVLKGRVVENKFVRLACERYRRMRAEAESGKAPFTWSPAHVIEACAFIERCPQVEGGAGEPLQLEPFQCWMLCALFGFRENVAGRSVRWVREFLYDGPRKSGKTALGAPIDLYCFLYEEERGSQILLAASSRPQAEKAFRPIRQILIAEPELAEAHELRVTAKQIRRPDGGFIGTISAIGRKEDGAIPHVAHIDELHAVSEALHEVVVSSFGARANELLLQTTTAGTRASGPAYAQRKRLERVLQGQEHAPRFFGVIYTVDVEDQRAPLTWENVVKAHPMLGVTIKESTVRDDLEAARFSPVRKAEFLAKRLNIYSQGSAHAILPADWSECFDEKLKTDAFIGREAFVGVDLSQRDDQTAVAVMFEDGEDIVVFAWHYLPAESPAFANENIADDLNAWAESGHLTKTDGGLVDLTAVERKIVGLTNVFDVQAVVFDQAHTLLMVQRLVEQGIPAGAIRGNAVELAEPTKDILARVRHRRLRHDGNPVLAWNAQNTCVTPGDLPRPVKDRTAPHLKIDGISALAHANVARLGRVQARMPKIETPPNPRIRALSDEQA